MSHTASHALWKVGGGLVGLIAVLRSSFSWRRRFIRLQRRYPRFVFPIRRLLRRDTGLLAADAQRIVLVLDDLGADGRVVHVGLPARCDLPAELRLDALHSALHVDAELRR